VKRPIDQRSNHMPDFRPAFTPGLAQCLEWVLCPRDWRVRVVIELNIVRSPPQYVWKAIGEDDSERSSQRRRPLLNGSHQGFRPIERGDAPSHFATAGEKGKEIISGTSRSSHVLHPVLKSGSRSTNTGHLSISTVPDVSSTGIGKMSRLRGKRFVEPRDPHQRFQSSVGLRRETGPALVQSRGERRRKACVGGDHGQDAACRLKMSISPDAGSGVRPREKSARPTPLGLWFR
jgi:hypothetical protein